MHREDISFQTADRVTLRGWFFRPPGADQAAQLPCLVMSSGFTAVIGIELDVVAGKFISQLQISCLVYDHRGFGISDTNEGSPRQEIIPAQQTSDMSDAITYAQSRADVNMDNIGLWGTSYSGGHVLHVAAFDHRVKVVLSQVPCVDGWATAHRLTRPDYWAEVNAAFTTDRLARAAGRQPAVIPVVHGDPETMCALPTPRSYQWFSSWTSTTTWRNEVTLKSLETFREYVPAANIHRISPTPLLLTVAEADTLTPTDITLEAYGRALEPKKLHLFPGDHFDVYSEQSYDSNIAVQAAFIEAHLLK